MSKPLTLSEKLSRRADAADEECRTDDADLFREAGAEIDRLREAATFYRGVPAHQVVTDEMVNAYKLEYQLYLADLPARAPVNFAWNATKAALEAVFGPALSAKDAEIAKLREALTPFADAAENLEDDHRDSSPIWEAPAAMSIDAKNLRAARAALKEQADA